MSIEIALEHRAERVANLRAACAEIFSGHPEATLEIGCGKGHYLSAYAAANPSELCVGLDLISERVRDSERRAKNLGAQNARFLKAEASEFLDALPAAARLAKIFIFFPDPWPKAKHHKRRLINNAFLDALRERSKAGAKLYFRTDHDEYFEWALEIFGANSSWKLMKDNALPMETVSQFQRILPNFSTLAAEAV